MLRHVVGLVARREQRVVGQHGELFGHLREELVRERDGIDLDRSGTLLEAPGVLGAQQVDTTVELAAPPRNVKLVRHLLHGQPLEIGIGERGEVGKGLHAQQSSRFADLPPGVEVEDRGRGP